MIFQKARSVIFMLAGASALTGCLWGDGSDVVPVRYNGKTTPAEITKENGKDIAVTGTSGQQMDSVNGFSAGAEINGAVARKVSATPVMFPIAQSIMNDMRRIRSGDVPAISVAGVTTTVSGNCGGSYTEDDNGISSTIALDDYCEDGLTESGKIIVTRNGDSLTSSSASIQFLQYRNYSADHDISMSGTMSVSVYYTIGTFVFSFDASLDYRDNRSGLTGRMENYRFSIENGEMTISGRIYHALYGYVDIETITPIGSDVSTGQRHGKIRYKGQNSSVTLEYLANGMVKLTVENSGRVVYTEEVSFEEVFTAN